MFLFLEGKYLIGNCVLMCVFKSFSLFLFRGRFYVVFVFEKVIFYICYVLGWIEVFCSIRIFMFFNVEFIRLLFVNY